LTGVESGARLSVLYVWQKCSFSRREDVLTFNSHFLKRFKFCTFSTLYKDNSVINCITVEHKRVSFQSTFTSHTLLLYSYILHS
jgi:hypothetical protein